MEEKEEEDANGDEDKDEDENEEENEDEVTKSIWDPQATKATKVVTRLHVPRRG